MQGRGEEAASPGGRGGTGGDRYVDHRLWDPPRSGHLLQVPGYISLSGGLLLTSGGSQSSEGTAEVGADD